MDDVMEKLEAGMKAVGEMAERNRRDICSLEDRKSSRGEAWERAKAHTDAHVKGLKRRIERLEERMDNTRYACPPIADKPKVRFDAGLCTVPGCEDMEKAKIRFQKDGRWALLCDQHFKVMCDGNLTVEEALV